MSSVRVIRRQEPAARSERIDAEIERLTEELRRLGATRIVLFGSRARGEAGPASDVDLIAVGPWEADLSFTARLDRLWGRLQPTVALDLLPYTEAELERLRETSPLVRRALREGRVLHEAA